MRVNFKIMHRIRESSHHNIGVDWAGFESYFRAQKIYQTIKLFVR
jgi:hypothetical protein